MMKALFALSLLFVSSAAFAQFEDVPSAAIDHADIVCQNDGGAYAIDLGGETPRVWQTDGDAKEGIPLAGVKITPVADVKRAFDVEGILLTSVRVELSIRKRHASIRITSLENGSEIPALPSYRCKFLKLAPLSVK